MLTPPNLRRSQTPPRSRPRAAVLLSGIATTALVLCATGCGNSGPKRTPTQAAAHDACNRLRDQAKPSGLSAGPAQVNALLAKVTSDINVSIHDPALFRWSAATKSWVAQVQATMARTPVHYTLGTDNAGSTVMSLLISECHTGIRQ